MNARQLEALRAVMETRTVTGAAARMRISQPAVSKLIAALERETGIALFRRERKRLVPTAEAGLLYEEARRQFAALANVGDIADSIRDLRIGKLTVVSLPALGLRVLPRLLARFAAARPEARVELQVRTSPSVVDSIMAQGADLGISLIPVDVPGIVSEILARIEAVCILPVGHPLSAKSVIRPVDLGSETFVSLGREDRTRHMVDYVFEQAGVGRRMQIETHLSEVACEFVAEGAGISVIDSLTAAIFGPRIVALPFRPALTFNIYILSSSIRPPPQLAAAFRRELLAEIDMILKSSTDPQRPHEIGKTAG